MSSNAALKPSNTPAVDRIWFTRCPVPTATGLAYKLGWLTEEFARDGIPLSTLQEDARNSDLSRHHYDHELNTLIREGGNMLSIAARAQGAKTRLIGLTWIDEGQAIIARPDSGIREPKDLKGRRIALPSFIEHRIPSHIRGSSIGRGMTLAGVRGALAYAGLSFDDVTFVEVEARRIESGAAPANAQALQNLWWGLNDLVQGRVDAVYVKGASAVDAAKRLGVVVAIDLDTLPDRRFRVNNGTPRPITVHEDFLNDHLDLVSRFIAQSLRAADWAVNNEAGVREVLQSETRGSADGVAAAYRNDFHKSLHPDLSPERLALFRKQIDFLLLHGFLERDFDLEEWTDRRPLENARKLLEQGK
ncbi:ABC transporter substrate-binding protein [Peristeroidobacter soli]|jgi:ABC-type nitrate/sulfonate/bicarbonate transport system substrate-binding protein|uniref:ABC transporter substrate-binding protein n=1 Tax=Peristeroidobacter soli TaxID=2497877 RepID=UPI00101D8B38|nr:ABC transporter substrate-binding protein [Peristeroidobacter soli]